MKPSDTSIQHLRIFRINHVLIISAIVGLALFLRVFMLDLVPRGLYWDEIAAVYVPFLYHLGVVPESIGHDPSQRTLVSHFLTGSYFTYFLVGPSTFLSRLNIALIGTIHVFIMYLLTKEMFSKRIALVTALLMAITPWALHFNRHEPFPTGYAFYFSLALLFAHKGIHANTFRRKVIWYCSASFVFGLTANILSEAIVFVPLFVSGFALIYLLKNRSVIVQIMPRWIPVAIMASAIFILSYSAVILEFTTDNPNRERAVSQSTITIAENPGDLLEMVIKRIQMHISPDFLVFRTTSSHDIDFSPTIQQSELLRQQPTNAGLLNYYGFLVYLGLALLAYRSITSKQNEYLVILWWIATFLIISGIAYYNNPHAGRNIVGMPALIITIALAIDFIINLAYNHKSGEQPKVLVQFKHAAGVIKTMQQHKIAKMLIVSSLICLITIPTGLFLFDYYVIYAIESAPVYDYGYQEIADFLSDNDLWDRNIILHDKWGRDLILNYYEPVQPPTSNIYSTTDVRWYNPVNSLASVSKNFNFSHGIIEYETRIDEGYGGSSSSHLQLKRDIDRLELSIHTYKSTWSPNTYFIQQVTDGKYNAEQGSIPNVLGYNIEYGKWYKVKLEVEAGALSLYVNDEHLTTWAISPDDEYQTLILQGESATVSFKNLIIESDGRIHKIIGEDFDDSSWIKGSMSQLKFVQDVNGATVMTLSPIHESAILITSHMNDIDIIEDNGFSPEILKEVYYPDGSLAFSIVELNPVIVTK